MSPNTGITEARKQKFQQCRKRLLRHFDDVDIRSVTPADAREYSESLLEQNNEVYKSNPRKLSPATVNKEIQVAHGFFEYAVDKRYLDSNPFKGVTVGSSTNDERKLFIERDIVDRVIDACPNWQWRTVAALARYGALRIASEIVGLKWDHVNWDQCRFTVHSPKTKRYGKATRVVPIFPELRPYFDEAWDMAIEGGVYVLPKWGGMSPKNLSTTFKKIIVRAGLIPWPKPFQNLRASRCTELIAQHPEHVVTAWCGHTKQVASKHYWQVTEKDFAEATGNALAKGTTTFVATVETPPKGEPVGVTLGLTTPVKGGNGYTPKIAKRDKRREKLQSVGNGNGTQTGPVAGTGFEVLKDSGGKSQFVPGGVTKPEAISEIPGSQKNPVDYRILARSEAGRKFLSAVAGMDNVELRAACKYLDAVDRPMADRKEQ